MTIDLMKTRTHRFRIAGFRLDINLPGDWDADAMLPSFRPFRFDDCGTEGCLLDCMVAPLPAGQTAEPTGKLIEESDDEMGHTRLYADAGAYLVALSLQPGGTTHFMQADKDFSHLRISLCKSGTDAGPCLSSLLRIAYSQAILSHDALDINASPVYHDRRAYLFLGKSGTGKSTHSSLWMKHVSGTGLLNDDNPTVRIMGEKAYAWGTPWSGKTPCYKDCFYPVGGMVRLSQAAENRFRRLEGTEAFAALLPGCAVIRQDAALCDRLYDTLVRLAEDVPVGTLACRPDREAALVCSQALLGMTTSETNQSQFQ